MCGELIRFVLGKIGKKNHSLEFNCRSVPTPSIQLPPVPSNTSLQDPTSTVKSVVITTPDEEDSVHIVDYDSYTYHHFINWVRQHEVKMPTTTTDTSHKDEIDSMQKQRDEALHQANEYKKEAEEMRLR